MLYRNTAMDANGEAAAPSVHDADVPTSLFKLARFACFDQQANETSTSQTPRDVSTPAAL